MHVMLLQLECCGSAGPSDYILPPNSCYNSETDKLNLEGCRQKFYEYIQDRWTILNIFALVLIVVELISAILCICLAIVLLIVGAVQNTIRNRFKFVSLCI
ncbi:hypothetical protein DOY81_011929 [Sarcophaga bullata]|nr:hypothetical protein DOY81_011929 [Sarcophaga bullata]